MPRLPDQGSPCRLDQDVDVLCEDVRSLDDGSHGADHHVVNVVTIEGLRYAGEASSAGGSVTRVSSPRDGRCTVPLPLDPHGIHGRVGAYALGGSHGQALEQSKPVVSGLVQRHSPFAGPPCAVSGCIRLVLGWVDSLGGLRLATYGLG